MDNNKILLAHSQPEMLDTLGKIIQLSYKYNLVKETTESATVLEFIINSQPNIAIIDERLGNLNKLSIAKYLFYRNCKTKLIFIAQGANQNPEIIRSALACGVKGYTRFNNSGEVLECIEAVSNNEYYIDTELHYAHYFAQTG